ncbi:prolactin isoform X3 [Fukomys damarensis]|uniref:prolactin isoform X3 n=1 Tax=Fukomys damarensis TaxID=885580 RepID=UPI00053FF5A5|nr:prolactin isoform X3 [Fukomys damarensis]
MDIKGKGSVLLLLVSTLVLCQNVSSSTCVPREKCEVMLQGLYNNASYLAWSIRFHGEKACLDLVNLHYSRPTYFLSSRKRCHTADILTRPERRGARRMQEKDLLHMVMRLLDSWKEPLPHVAEETHKFMKFYSPIKKKDESIYLRYQQFKSVIIEIASKVKQAYPENSTDCNSRRQYIQGPAPTALKVESQWTAKKLRTIKKILWTTLWYQVVMGYFVFK